MSPSSAPSELFPSRLRTAREQLRHLSQAELAERSGLQASAISHFETGSRKPSFDNLRRLAEALSVTTDYLLGRESEPGAAGERIEALYRDLKDASDEEQGFIQAYLETRRKVKKRDI